MCDIIHPVSGKGFLSKKYLNKPNIWTTGQHFPTQVHMVTWVGVGLIGELPQGHGKVISRSQQGQISWKRWK